jgi:hypothetical protein
VSSHRWTTVARVAVLLIVAGVCIDLLGWKPGGYIAAGACLVFLMTLNAP